MTVMAGVLARREGGRVPDETCRALERALSRHPGERVVSFRNDRVFLAKFDINAFAQPAFLVEHVEKLGCQFGSLAKSARIFFMISPSEPF